MTPWHFLTLLALTLVVETDLAQRAHQSWLREEPRAASVC